MLYFYGILVAFQNLFFSIYDVIVIGPFRRLYFQGPEISGFGFWQGRPSNEICSMITGVSGDLWIKNMYECEDLLDRKFVSFVILVEIVLYVYVVYKIFQLLTIRFLFVHPIVQKLEALSDLLQNVKECRDNIKDGEYNQRNSEADRRVAI